MTNTPWRAELWRLGQGWQGAGAAVGTLKAAMNKVDRPYRTGRARAVNTNTGEEWGRRGGSWFRTVPASARRAP